jgi:predicted 3-demethylubiquinone-9 3-methyltransferase (glyoxalase superfamily)
MPRKISTCLWFDNDAEQAIQFYLSVFPDGELLNVLRNGEHGPGPKGSLLAATFRIEDQQIEVINGGPAFKLSEAVSLVVHCDDQAEVDRLWDKLGNGGQYQQCGWLKDRFGLCWQIVPRVLYEMMQDPDPARAGRVMQAMLQMVKLDIAALERARDGTGR